MHCCAKPMSSNILPKTQSTPREYNGTEASPHLLEASPYLLKASSPAPRELQACGTQQEFTNSFRTDACDSRSVRHPCPTSYNPRVLLSQLEPLLQLASQPPTSSVAL